MRSVTLRRTMEQRAMNPSEDPFAGAWELGLSVRPSRTARSLYDRSRAGWAHVLPRRGDAEGRPMKFTYGGELDGREQSFPEDAGVLVVTRLNERIIESIL